MTHNFCLNNSSIISMNHLWSRQEIDTAKINFKRAAEQEARMREIVTRIVYSPLLHAKYPMTIPKYHILYPIPKDRLTVTCHEFKVASDALLTRKNKDTIEAELKTALENVNNVTSFAETMAARKFLHLAGFEKESKELEEKELQRCVHDLALYTPLHGIFERYALQMAQGAVLDEQKINAELDQVLRWKSRFFSNDYDTAVKIVRHPEKNHASLILDAYCFLSVKDNSKFIKTLAYSQMEKILYFSPSEEQTPFYNRGLNHEDSCTQQ